MAGKGIEPFPAAMARLRSERSLSREALSRMAYMYDHEGTSTAQLIAIEKGMRRASPSTIEAYSKALDIDPSQFPEYRLGVARERLDERTVGLLEALKNLGEPVPTPTPEIREAIDRMEQLAREQAAKRAAPRAK